MGNRFSTHKPQPHQVKHPSFSSYSNSALDSYASAVFKLWEASGQTDNLLKQQIIAAGEEKTFRGMW